VTDALTTQEVPAPPLETHLECLFYTEAQTADRLGIHRTTLRNLALSGKAPCKPFQFTAHRRFYRRIDVDRLGGIEP
jgi:hypothetical protein